MNKIVVNTVCVKPELLPKYKTGFSVGLDLYANIDDVLVVCPGEKFKFSSGVIMEIPVGYEGKVKHRSSIFDRGLIIMGTIDPDYRGEIIICGWNVSKELIPIYPGERVAQLVISPIAHAELQLVKFVSETDRGTGGFGHTGMF